MEARGEDVKREYLVTFSGRPASEATWHNELELLSCRLLLEDFQASETAAAHAEHFAGQIFSDAATDGAAADFLCSTSPLLPPTAASSSGAIGVTDMEGVSSCATGNVALDGRGAHSDCADDAPSAAAVPSPTTAAETSSRSRPVLAASATPPQQMALRSPRRPAPACTARSRGPPRRGACSMRPPECRRGR